MNQHQRQYKYEINVSQLQAEANDKEAKAQECMQLAEELERMGYPAIASWERSLARKYTYEARVAREAYE